MALRLPWKRRMPDPEAFVDLPEDAELVTLMIGEKTYRDLSVVRTPDKAWNFRLPGGLEEGATVELIWTAEGRGGEGTACVVRATEATIGIRATRVATGLQRRGSLRVPATVPLTLNGPEDTTFSLTTRNLSLGGALAFGRGPEPGEPLPGRLDLPGQFVTVNARVLPGLDPVNVHRLLFVGLTTQAEDLIADYVAAQERRRAYAR
ncbi:hypothetical protein J2S43_004227 [Catenuloplanes nepalensis]|uniref:PilZ domain-containing protein n=1 Tax=Catenuloplanes nepalensis TaxID=587533 RepID=A0ABT9MWA5_9ACTN|nr:PilZ domain-containing protein [Catenuloplanes nepalensis]MDP9795715.1 hypothetical protein [Catenuloplanes nepalensis]